MAVEHIERTVCHWLQFRLTWFMVSMNHWVSGAKRSASSPSRLTTSAFWMSSVVVRRYSIIFSTMTCGPAPITSTARF